MWGEGEVCGWNIKELCWFENSVGVDAANLWKRKRKSQGIGQITWTIDLQHKNSWRIETVDIVKR